MFYNLAFMFRQSSLFFNLLHYTTVRSMAALLTSLGAALFFGNWFIQIAKERFASKPRNFTPASHQAKENTPTMGGILILSSALFSILLWGNLLSVRLWLCVLTLVGFGLIGLVDDWRKLHRLRGITAKTKFMAQLAVAALVVGIWVWVLQPNTCVVLPFFKHLQPNLGVYGFILWAIFVIIACSNAVNLTDGLDGLATSSLITNFGVFALAAYVAGHAQIAWYLQLPFVGSAELTVVCGALIGACLGFLWYNSYPAQIFMGDVGSVSLGAVLALIALMSKQELLILIAGGLFVLETVSVILQVLSFRYFKRRIFKMAPLHHHFELIGWPESKITVRFAIISIVLGMLALATFKIR